jgi:hypothetical protein
MPRGVIVRLGQLLDHVCRVVRVHDFLHVVRNSANVVALVMSSNDFCALSPTRQVLLPKQHESEWNIPARCLTKTKSEA